MRRKTGCGVTRATTGAPGISTRCRPITAMTATGSISARRALTAVASTAAALVRAGRGPRSARSGIAADRSARRLVADLFATGEVNRIPAGADLISQAAGLAPLPEISHNEIDVRAGCHRAVQL